MVEHNYHQATLHHLAYRQQDLVPHLGDSVRLDHNPWQAAAGLEAYLSQQRQQ